jgi:hypothetical protein
VFVQVNWNTEESKKVWRINWGGMEQAGREKNLRAEFVDAAGLAPGNSRDLITRQSDP